MSSSIASLRGMSMGGAFAEKLDSLEERITEILLEYAQRAPDMRPLDSSLSLHDDLEIESLQLVSVALRLGDELEVDLIERGVELANLRTVGDLVSLGRSLQLR